jgi:hypothetical protein
MFDKTPNQLLATDCSVNSAASVCGRCLLFHWPCRQLYHLYKNFIEVTILVVRDTAVSIATRYGLISPGIKSQMGEIFGTRPDRPLGLTQLPVPRIPDHFRV